MSKLENDSKQGYEMLMTCVEVAEFLRVHVSSVRRWSRSGRLKAYKVGGRGDWRYKHNDVLAFLCSYDAAAVKSETEGERPIQRQLVGIGQA
jgi:excisionase family DNA binding protein